MLRRAVLLIVATILVGGSLGASLARDEISFNSIRRHDFNAIAVTREMGPASSAPLIVRVHVVGDAASTDISEPIAWLQENANVVILPARDGVPLYLTARDLSATSGRATLGATVDTGMAVEVGAPRVAPCVIAHEVLHFLGLGHVSDPKNIMYAECSRNQLLIAELTSEQRAQIDATSEVLATTLMGVVQWASR
ncbi:MAG: matrixin family metalloprotease [Candidatus Thermoplasmatota archaeon]